MIVDMNVYIGRWPFAPLGHESAEDVLRLMDSAGIERAALTSLDSVFYYDAEIGNHEAGKACLRYPDRFIPFAVINPALLGWRRHLAECVERYGVRGIRLHPDYHKFSLVPDQVLGAEIAGVMDEAAARTLPVHIQTSLLDVRHHPGYCYVPEVPIADVAQALRRYPRTQFIVGGALWFWSRAQELITLTAPAGIENYWLLTDGFGGPFDGYADLVTQLGSTRFLFSSRTPLLYTEAARDVLELSEISDTEKEQIRGGNAARMFGLGTPHQAAE